MEILPESFQESNEQRQHVRPARPQSQGVLGAVFTGWHFLSITRASS